MPGSRRIQQREDVEEVAPNGARRAIVVGDLPAVGLDAGQEDEGSLDPLCDLELALDEPLDLELALDEVGVRGRRSGPLERRHGRGAVRIDREEPAHAGPLEDSRDRILGRGDPDVAPSDS